MLKFLEPIKRILWIFIPLFISLLLLFLDLLVRDNAFGWYNHTLSIWLLLSSCVIFIYVMGTFLYLVIQLVRAKEILKQDELDLILAENSTNVEALK